MLGVAEGESVPSTVGFCEGLMEGTTEGEGEG